MTEEEKGFVIKDRRSFDEKGDLKKEAKGGTKKEEKKEEPKRKPQDRAESIRESGPLPEVNFSSLIFSLSSTALLHCGEITDPVTGENKKDLPLAKHAIDTISMLKDKTKGNLTEEEQKFIDAVLNDLKWRYIKAAK